MKLEITQLMKQKTWQRIDKILVPTGMKVLKVIWALKLKRLPDVTPFIYKGGYYVRYLQTEDVDYFKTYAPVVQ